MNATKFAYIALAAYLSIAMVLLSSFRSEPTRTYSTAVSLQDVQPLDSPKDSALTHSAAARRQDVRSEDRQTNSTADSQQHNSPKNSTAHPLQHNPPKNSTANPLKHNLSEDNSKGNKIAFLFLIRNVIESSEIWLRYLESDPIRRWSLYIHLPPNTTSDGLLPFFRPFVLPESERKPTQYCTDLYSSMFALMKAALKDPDNAKFVMVSANHVPVKSFATFRAALFRDRESWICVMPIFQWIYQRDNTLRVKHHQWVALDRQYVQEILSNPNGPLPKDFKDMIPKGRCGDEYLFVPPSPVKREYFDKKVRALPWPGVNGGSVLLHAQARDGLTAPKEINLSAHEFDIGQHGKNDSSVPFDLLRVQAEQGRCTTYVFWRDYRSLSRFVAVGSSWKDTQEHHRYLKPSYCLLHHLVHLSDFFFARKLTDGSTVSRKCLDTPGRAPTQTLMSALEELGVFEPKRS